MSEVANLYVTLRSETAPFTAGMRRASQEGESFTTRMGGASAMLRKLGAATTVAGVAVAGMSIKMAGDFQASMVRLKTSASESGDIINGKLTGNLKKVQDGILDLAVKTGTSTGQLSAAMLKIEAAGFHGAKGLKLLQSAAEGARAEGADLEPVANTLDSTMNSFGFSANKSNNVMNAFVATVAHGKLSMADLASALSTVTPIAGQAGIALEQMLGAMSTMSAQGVTAQQAAQNLQFTIKQLKGPSTVARNAMASIGVDATDVAQKLGKRGLTGTFDLLNQAITQHMGKSGLVVVETMNKSKAAMQSAQTLLKGMTGDTHKLAQAYLTGSISAAEYRKQTKALPSTQANLANQFKATADNANGFNKQVQNGTGPFKTYADLMRKMTGGSVGLNTALELGGQHAKTFKTNVAAIGKATGDSSKHVEGFAETQKTFNQQLRVLHERIEVAAIKLGTVLLPAAQKVLGFFSTHTNVVKGLAVVIGTVLTAAVISFATGAITGAVKGVADFSRGIMAAAKAVKAFALSERLAAIATKIWAGIQAVFNAIMDANPIVLVIIAVVALVAALIYAYNHSARFRAIVQAAWEGIKQGALMLWHALQAVWNGLVTGVTWLWHAVVGIWNAISSTTSTVWNAIAGFFRKWWPLLLVIFALPIAILIGIWNHFHTQITAMVHAVWNGIAAFFTGIWNGIKVAARVAWTLIQIAVINPMKAAWSALKSLWNTIKGWLSSAWGGIRDVAASVWSGIKSAIVNPVMSLWKTVSSYMGKVSSSIKSKLTEAWNAAKSWGSKFVSIGKDIVMGIISGVKDSGGALFSSLGHLANSALNAAKNFIKSGSPSRLFADKIGAPISQGIAAGVDEHAHTAHTAIRNVANGMVSQASKTLGIASPSKVFRNLGIYINEGLVDGLTGSTAKVKAATKRIETLLIQTYNKVADQRGKKGVSNKWVASHEKAIKRLESYAAKEDKVLRGLAAKRDAVAAKLKTAQSKLATLQKAWSDEVKSVADGVMQGFSVVTAAPQEGFALTAQDVVNKMRDQMSQAVQFAAELQALKKKGLSSDLIAQIAASGVDQGGATAAALQGASSAQIKQINSLNTATKSAATSAGKAVADSMYGAGIRSAQGLVKGLQSQEKAIEKQMMRIAESMKKAIKRALGIKSPSTVFAEIGTWIPKGLAKGVGDGAHHATAAVQHLAGSVAGAGSYGSAGLAVAGGGAVVNNYTVNVNVEGSIRSDRDIRDVVEQQMLRVGMRNPATYAAYKR